MCTIGLIEGDEVVLINDTAVSHMNWKTIMETIKGKWKYKVTKC